MAGVSMSYIEGFPPIVSAKAKILILGSMPSETSLLRQQYYGHARNAFWPIMSVLFDFDPELGYQLRKNILMENHVAVWDVLQSCSRPGSLDSNIEMESIRINDFARFFAGYKLIKRVFFNGKMAEKVYQQRVQPVLYPHFNYLEYQSLPSTSPAYASLTLEQKLEAWKVIKQYVVK
jgi:TDG/mug DNA glycosylase family protein